MREYGKIHSSFWTSQDIRDVGEDGRTLAAYLLTSPHSNMLGCFRIPPAYVSEDLKWPMERVQEGFAKLSSKGFATLSEGSFWIVIHKFLKWNQPENPNVVKAAIKLFDQIPDGCGVKPLLAKAIKEYEPRFPVEKLNPLKTLCKPFPNPSIGLETGVRKPEPEPEPLPEPDKEPPIPPKGGLIDDEKHSKKRSAISLKTYLADCKASGEKPIPETDTVFDYATKTGIPEDFLRLHWLEFKARYSEEGAKRYKDWRSVFRKSVRGCWFKLWWIGADGSCLLTTVGEQAKRAHGRDAA